MKTLTDARKEVKMKKEFLLVMAAIIAFSSAVIADDFYVVKANQSLAQIAREHGLTLQEIRKANPWISDPTVIRTGQEIKIPSGESSLTEQLKIPEAGFLPWINPGGNPFIAKGDSIRAINMFALPDSVKAGLIAKVKNGEFEYYYIRHGDHFNQMIFGNYKMENKLIGAWPDSTKQYMARKYFYQFLDLIYYLAVPGICHNWSWWSEKAPEKPAIVKPEEPKKSEPPPEEKQEVQVEKPPPTAAPEEAKNESIFARRSEVYAWTGHYFPAQGTGGGNYYGGKGNIFFSTTGSFLGRFHLGVGAIANGWEGTTGSGFSYNGYRATAGPVLDMTMKNYRFTVSSQFGFQNDQGRDGKGYKSNQDDSILYFGLTADSYNEFFKVRKVEAWIDFVFDVDHSKKGWWSSSRIARSNDPAGNKGSINFGSRYYLWAINGFKTGVVAKSSYAYEDRGVTGIVGFVLSSRQDVYKFGVEFKNTSNSKYQDANGNSIGVTFDLEPKKVF